jgi:hypothetical protein
MDIPKKQNSWVSFLQEQALKKGTNYALELADIDNKELYRLHKEQQPSIKKNKKQIEDKPKPVKKQLQSEKGKPINKQNKKINKKSKKQNDNDIDNVIMV